MAYTQEEIIIQFKKAHNDFYDYSKVVYQGNKIKVCIICPVHGEFWQIPKHHKKGHGCWNCRNEKISKQKTKITSSIISEFRLVHGKKYDYSKVNYEDGRIKVCIICNKHGEFWVRPSNHIHRKSGCPKCKSSRGEATIAWWLKINKIVYTSQARFTKCKGKRNSLPFDFYLPEYNTCIEYNGRQHYDENSKYYSKELIQNDKTKAQYCLDNNIRLIVIPYCEDVYELLNSLNLTKAASLVL